MLGKGLEDFTYSDKDMGDLILKNIWAQKFLGISGDLFFDENGDSPRDVVISQFRGRSHMSFHDRNITLRLACREWC